MRIGKDKEELFLSLTSLLCCGKDKDKVMLVEAYGRVFNVFSNWSNHFTQALPKIEEKIYDLSKLKL